MSASGLLRSRNDRRSTSNGNGSDNAPDANAHPCVVENGRTTFVMVPIDEYEEMVKREMVQDAIRTLDDPNTEWVDAGDLALELAGEEIAHARKAQGLTQKQLGAKLGLPQSQISRIERKPDRTTVRTLKRIAKALNVDVRVFLAAV